MNRTNFKTLINKYLEDIDNGDVNAMLLLGCYYNDIDEDYDLMKKYYKMAKEIIEQCII